MNCVKNYRPNWEECRPCTAFASYTLAYAVQLREKHGKPSVRVEYVQHVSIEDWAKIRVITAGILKLLDLKWKA